MSIEADRQLLMQSNEVKGNLLAGARVTFNQGISSLFEQRRQAQVEEDQAYVASLLSSLSQKI